MAPPDAFDFQHGFREVARGGVRDFRWEQLREAALHFVHVGDFGFAKAEKLSVAAADVLREPAATGLPTTEWTKPRTTKSFRSSGASPVTFWAMSSFAGNIAMSSCTASTPKRKEKGSISEKKKGVIETETGRERQEFSEILTTASGHPISGHPTAT
jgi:hypothetical protein